MSKNNDELLKKMHLDIEEAKHELRCARDAFNYAEYDYIPSASMLLTAAELKLNALYARNKIVESEVKSF